MSVSFGDSIALFCLQLAFLIDLTQIHSSKIVTTAFPSNRLKKSIVYLIIEFTEKENPFPTITFFESKDVVSANALHRPFEVISNV